ncbi:MAG: type VI secretion system contractile sheath small subunit [Bacteroidetes bacterium]|nr:type VI secretion system contractile sheath small subunit [Bacteroidota bacterium]
MAQSFQREKPPARINLFLEVATGDAQEKLELPMRLLVMGDYKGRKDGTPVADREILNLNKDNFETVLSSMDIKLDYTVPDTLKGGDEEMMVSLDIDSMKSFSPEEVVRQVPQLNRMMAMRNLLQDLRNRIVSLPDFRRQLEKIVKDDAALEQLKAELDQIVMQEEEGGAPDEEA